MFVCVFVWCVCVCVAIRAGQPIAEGTEQQPWTAPLQAPLTHAPAPQTLTRPRLYAGMVRDGVQTSAQQQPPLPAWCVAPESAAARAHRLSARRAHSSGGAAWPVAEGLLQRDPTQSPMQAYAGGEFNGCIVHLQRPAHTLPACSPCVLCRVRPGGLPPAVLLHHAAFLAAACKLILLCDACGRLPSYVALAQAPWGHGVYMALARPLTRFLPLCLSCVGDSGRRRGSSSGGHNSGFFDSSPLSKRMGSGGDSNKPSFVGRLKTWLTMGSARKSSTGRAGSDDESEGE